MIIQLPAPLPCEALRSKEHHCNRDARLALLDQADLGLKVSFTLKPICDRCIAALASLSSPAAAPAEETIATAQIRQVLASHLGSDGADEVLSEIRAAHDAGDDDGEGLDDV